jgi:hypothetical protein
MTAIPKGKWPSPFALLRHEDATGISGTGLVAYGVQFPDGSCVLHWQTATVSTSVFADIADIEAVHGHGGKTEIVWLFE